MRSHPSQQAVQGWHSRGGGDFATVNVAERIDQRPKKQLLITGKFGHETDRIIDFQGCMHLSAPLSGSSGGLPLFYYWRQHGSMGVFEFKALFATCEWLKRPGNSSTVPGLRRLL
jgi:hypothetical protein